MKTAIIQSPLSTRAAERFPCPWGCGAQITLRGQTRHKGNCPNAPVDEPPASPAPEEPMQTPLITIEGDPATWTNEDLIAAAGRAQEAMLAEYGTLDDQRIASESTLRGGFVTGILTWRDYLDIPVLRAIEAAEYAAYQQTVAEMGAAEQAEIAAKEAGITSHRTSHRREPCPNGCGKPITRMGRTRHNKSCPALQVPTPPAAPIDPATLEHNHDAYMALIAQAEARTDEPTQGHFTRVREHQLLGDGPDAGQPFYGVVFRVDDEPGRAARERAVAQHAKKETRKA